MTATGLLLPSPLLCSGPSYEGSSEGTLLIVSELSFGTFGVVHRCMLASGATFAVKEVAGGAKDALGELICLEAGLSHANLLSVQEAFHNKRKLCLRLAYCSGVELFELSGKLSAGEALGIACGVAKALRYMHRRCLVHRDCKPENILVRGEVPLLVDLGSVRTLGSMAAVEGTQAYMAPEARARRQHCVLPALDVWSFGATLCVAVLGRVVKEKADAEKAASRKPGLWAVVDAACALLVKVEEDRPSLSWFLSRLALTK